MSEGRPVKESIARFAATSTRPARAAGGMSASVQPTASRRRPLDASETRSPRSPTARPRPSHSRPRNPEKRLRILLAVRLETLEGARERVVRLGGLHFGVDEQLRVYPSSSRAAAKVSRRSSRKASKDAAGSVRPSAAA